MKGRILLVDDNEAFLDSTKDVLEEEGYQISVASSGEEAIRKFGNSHFDVVVMDIRMPGLNGVEAFSIMKKFDPQVRVIICTAYIVENLIREALKEGAYSVLNKPFAMDLLIREIENARQPSRCGHILVADRDEELCARLQEVLAQKSHHVIVAHNGKEALAKAQEHSFNVLLLDLNLPDMNCLDLCTRVKRLQPNLFATIITGLSDEFDSDTQTKMRTLGGITSLTKPLNIDQLLELLESICTAGNPDKREPEDDRYGPEKYL